jgi:hypothetical protein
MPYLNIKQGKFKTPEGEMYNTLRAVVFDSWLIWHDVLPEEKELRNLLDQDSYDNICALARRLQTFHISLPGYKQLSVSPFNVTRWWDPSDEDIAWNSGRSCLFSMDNYEAVELTNLLPRRSPLQLRAVSRNFVEAHLPPEITVPDQATS